MNTKHDMAVDWTGRPLPLTGDQVRAKTMEALHAPDSELICCILRYHGELMVHVLGAPSQELVEILEQALEGYRAVLKGHG